MKNKDNKTILCRGTPVVVTILAFNLFATFMMGWQQTVLAGNPDSSQEWVSLFNGKDLTGWDGDKRLWSVRDGAIRGQTTITKPALHNTFLIWRDGKLKDFELKLKFRIQNGNSGVQYRSKEFREWRVSGYQAEVCNGGGVGFLYHERGRGGLVNVGDFVEINAGEEGKAEKPGETERKAEEQK